MSNLFLYATVYNTDDELIKSSIESIIPLNPERIVIIDVSDSDHPFPHLSKWEGLIELHRVDYCSRGMGRQIALEYALSLAKNNTDSFMYVDLDTVYSPLFIETVLKRKDNIGEKQVSVNHLSMFSTNLLIEWKDLNMGEDIERLAHFKSQGYQFVDTDFRPKDKRWFISNRLDERSQFKREKYYTRGRGIVKSIARMEVNAVDEHRAFAYKTWKGHSSSNPLHLMGNWIAHYIAIQRGLFSYSNELDNREYVK